MQIIDRGSGTPVVVIPGLQGRWEYVRASIDALADTCRPITFSLCDEPSAGARYDRENGLDSYVAQVEAALDTLGIQKAIVCGISFGGIIALRFAARHPERTSGLVLVSTPGPFWHLKRRHDTYARWPLVFGPLFLAETPFRLRREVRAAIPDKLERRRFTRRQVMTVLEAPVSTLRMAARARLIGQADRQRDCAAIACPALIIHGDAALDHVVDVGGTSEYSRLIGGAATAVIEQTGHLGSITRPREFAAIVARFADASRQDDHHSAA